MILHLMSSKMNVESSAFETKWNQLMPRKEPKVAKADSLSNGVVTQQVRMEMCLNLGPQLRISNYIND